MFTTEAAVVEIFPHYKQFLFVLIREHDLVAQPIAAATTAAAPFSAAVTLRAYPP